MTNKPTEKNNKLKSALLKSHRATQTSDSAFADQVGGDWYKKLKIQPLDYCMDNNFNACQTKVIKYISRYKYYIKKRRNFRIKWIARIRS